MIHISKFQGRLPRHPHFGNGATVPSNMSFKTFFPVLRHKTSGTKVLSCFAFPLRTEQSVQILYPTVVSLVQEQVHMARAYTVNNSGKPQWGKSVDADRNVIDLFELVDVQQSHGKTLDDQFILIRAIMGNHVGILHHWMERSEDSPQKAADIIVFHVDNGLFAL
jgi:hypothetical protein